MYNRLARIVVLALVLGVGISQIIFILADWHLRDMGAYWEAGLRVRSGAELYPPLSDPEASDVYRYAPWFAWLWAPITLAPRELVHVAWSAILLAASALALIPLYRERGWVAMGLFAPILFVISGIGNVHPLLIAALVHGVERRSGPIWIALCASLKVVPILFVLTYVGRREWGRVALTLGATLVLTAPMLRYDLSAYPTTAGAAAGLVAYLPVYLAVVAGGGVLAVRLARGRFAWLASSALATVATPRLFAYDITYLLVSFAPRRPGEPRR